MLDDHYQRICTQQQQDAENAAMEEMGKYAAPLLWVILVCVLAVLASNVATFVSHYHGLVAVNKAMAQCINGRSISLGDAVLDCKVQEYRLVSGLAQRGQL